MGTMRHPIIRAIGVIMVGLAGILIAMQVVLALRSGHAFYGENYKFQPLGVVYPIAAFAVLSILAAFAATRYVLWALKRKRNR